MVGGGIPEFQGMGPYVNPPYFLQDIQIKKSLDVRIFIHSQKYVQFFPRSSNVISLAQKQKSRTE